MNWLAHLLLSPPDIEVRLGNVLADFVRGPDRELMSAAFREGVRRHQLIDVFTDTHAVVQRSKERIDPRFRRLSGILIDIFYDHLLARNWDQFCKVRLREFTLHFNQEAFPYRDKLPEEAAWVLQRMIEEDRLWSYHEIGGIEAALKRLSRRLSERWHREIRLHDAMPSLIACDAELEQDFLEFFPQLVEAQ